MSLPFINIEYMDFQMPDLSVYKAILFNSVNSVTGFMRQLKDMRQLRDIKIGVVGEKTAEEMLKYKVIQDFFPEEYTVERLAEESVKFTGKGDRILFAVSDISPVKEDKYTQLYNRKYEKLIVYRTEKIKRGKEEIKSYIEKSDILMFLSSSTFEAFAEGAGLLKEGEAAAENRVENTEIMKLLKEKTIALIGPVTTKTIEKYNLKAHIEAKRYTEEGLMQEIILNCTV